jgi:hypothetical protein
MVIVVSKTTIKRCSEFAEARMQSSTKLYVDRGERQLSKIFRDIVGGTVAEFAVCNYLKSKNLDCTDPDLTIYEKRGKSYSPDLNSDDRRIHVKSQSAESAERHGLSWTFQKKDPLIWGPHKQDYLALTETKDNCVTIKAIVRARNLQDEHLYSEPKNTAYAYSKTVVYWDELLASGINLWEI